MNANPERGGPQTARNEARGRRNGRPSAGRAIHRHSWRRASHFLFLTHGSPRLSSQLEDCLLKRASSERSALLSSGLIPQELKLRAGETFQSLLPLNQPNNQKLFGGESKVTEKYHSPNMWLGELFGCY